MFLKKKREYFHKQNISKCIHDFRAHFALDRNCFAFYSLVVFT